MHTTAAVLCSWKTQGFTHVVLVWFCWVNSILTCRRWNEKQNIRDNSEDSLPHSQAKQRENWNITRSKMRQKQVTLQLCKNTGKSEANSCTKTNYLRSAKFLKGNSTVLKDPLLIQIQCILWFVSCTAYRGLPEPWKCIASHLLVKMEVPTWRIRNVLRQDKIKKNKTYSLMNAFLPSNVPLFLSLKLYILKQNRQNPFSIFPLQTLLFSNTSARPMMKKIKDRISASYIYLPTFIRTTHPGD